MATLLGQVNTILVFLNEQTVETVTESVTAQKARLALEQAIRKMVMLNNSWPWLQSILNAATWETDKATLDVSVLDTRFIRYANSHILEYENNREFFKRSSEPGEPRCYTRIGDDYFLYPYPDTTQRQDDTRFHVIQFPSLPSADNGEYTIPDEYLQLFRVTALTELAVTHLGDQQMAQYYKQEQQELYTYLKSKRMGVENARQTVIVED